MKKIYMYAHGGSGNHGCEAIVRSTIGLLEKVSTDKIVLFSSRPDEDIKYGVSEICEVINEKSTFSKFSINFLSAYLKLKIKKDYLPMDKLEYRNAFNKIKKGDIALSIGGDNYCYENVERYIMLHDLALERGAKTILWGCSVEPELIENHKIAKDLSRYSLIVARESISYDALKKVNANTVLVPDPAFSLKYKNTDLSSTYKERKIVGINISPMVQEQETVPGITMKNYQKLIDYIINSTDMEVLLIPHVVWDKNDDRESLYNLYDIYKNSNRVHIVEDQNCIKLKEIISCCSFFIGARTHSTIAAYSTGIPTIVVGYSVKAKGIARDLFGTDKNFVLPVQNISNSEELLLAFQWILEHEMDIKRMLKSAAGENTIKKYIQVFNKMKDLI